MHRRTPSGCQRRLSIEWQYVGMRAGRVVRRMTLAVVVLLTFLPASPAAAAAFSSMSVAPADPTADVASANSYTTTIAGASGTTVRCIKLSFEGDGGTVPSPTTGAWQYQGGSSASGSTITLNSSSQNFVGSIGAFQAALPSDGLHVTFDATIGPGGGADGMTFALLSPGAYGGYAGSGGGGLGYSGLTGPAVTMDTFQNGSDPSSNFIGIASSGTGSNITYIQTSTGVPALRQTNSYDITVSAGTVTVLVNGIQYLSAATAVTATVFPAFTAGTGASADAHSVSNISIAFKGGGASGTSAGLPPGMTVSSPSLSGSTSVTPGNWAQANSGDSITFTYATGEPVAAGTLKLNGITHNPMLAGTYYERVVTYSDVGCNTAVDNGTAALAITGATSVSAIVNPSLTFNIAGRASTCNGQSASNFQTTSTSSAVTMGRANASSTGGGAQDLSVTINAPFGFVVYLRTSDATPNVLNDGNGHSIADVSGTRASPGGAPGAGVEGFGYTSSDASTAFTSNTWAKLTNSNDSVLIAAPGVLTKSACVGYQVGVSAATPAGRYSVTVIYSVIPSF